MISKMISAAGYIRVSTAEQSRSGLSLETQRSEIEEYCKKHGYTLYKLYIDAGITARKKLEKRTAFMDMMDDVSHGRINHILVLRLDRFFRNVYDYHRMMEEYLTPNKCEWSAIREDYDTTTTNGRLMINLRLAISEQECDQDSDRIKDVMANRIKSGYCVSGSTPLGYKQIDHRLVPDDSAPIVQAAYRVMLDCGSVAKTRDRVEALGYNLRYYNLLNILKNEIYTGRKRENLNFCEPLISVEDYDRVQELIRQNVRKPLTPKSHVYIFSGLLKCDECGHRMSGCAGGTKRWPVPSYRCGTKFKDRFCKSKQISQARIESYLVENVARLYDEYAISVEEAKPKSEPAVSNRDVIERKIDRLTSLYVDGMIDMADFKKRKSDLESQIIDAPGRIEDNSEQIAATRELLRHGFKTIYADFTLEEKQIFWRKIIREIAIYRGEIVSVIFL